MIFVILAAILISTFANSSCVSSFYRRLINTVIFLILIYFMSIEMINVFKSLFETSDKPPIIEVIDYSLDYDN